MYTPHIHMEITQRVHTFTKPAMFCNIKLAQNIRTGSSSIKLIIGE